MSVHQAARSVYRRIRTGQSAVDLSGELATRRRAYRDAVLLATVHRFYGHEPTLLDAARWKPDLHDLAEGLRDLLKDALAATILLRTAEAVARTGVTDGLAASRPILKYGAGLLNAAARASDGDGHPARPGCYVHDLWQAVSGRSAQPPVEVLSTARDYGRVVFDASGDAIRELFTGGFDPRESPLAMWATRSMEGWRRAAGYHRAPASWSQVPVFHDLLSLGPLATRLADRPGQPPGDVEVAADLLWYADLGDALAVYRGRASADVQVDLWGPVVWPAGRPTDDDDPLRQVLESVPLAVAGAAQLVSIGGRVPERCGTWAELVDGLLATEALAEGRTGPFLLPDPFPGLDGTVLPGTALRVEFAHDSTALARWANDMGNCIASPHYAVGAQRGRRVLAALVDADGRPVVNLELRRGFPAGPWALNALAARFNADPEPALVEAVRRWVAALRTPTHPEAAPAAPAFNVRDNRIDPHGGRGTTDPPARDAEPIRTAPPRQLARRLLDDTAARLGDLVTENLATPASRGSLAVVTTLGTALHRATDHDLTKLVRAAIARPGGFDELWTATDVRPLTTAVAALPAELRDRYPALSRLTGDDELPRSLRLLVRTPKIAPGRTLEAVNARLRAALGRLARSGDPALATAVATESTTPALCALVTATSLWADTVDSVRILPPRRVRVPGFPASTLDDPDGPWQRAWPAVRDLGAPVDEFWDRIAVTGLVVPAAWLAGADWTVLWRRATARARHHRP
ncbi:hypothetical protein [Virgisporangium aurantiacum]|uniref:hypothetical protein n=1 Tax=Virgisporangium aurantiacum TaxID=175570 RepID=UPI00195235E1|nr:hypothetical protein [Virgisporangium aurantiacum]